MNIYNELEEIDVLRDRIKENQNQVLDIYDPRNDMMDKLLKEMNDLLVEVDQVEKEMEELGKQLWQSQNWSLRLRTKFLCWGHSLTVTRRI